jgi:hypothetical protein
MNASDILRLLNTSHYAPADLEEVNKLCRNFPEFGIAHMLKVRIMETLGYENQKELKNAAVYSMDRRKLFQLVKEVGLPAEPVIEAEPVDDSTGIINFSEEPNQHADIIIEQHAPYAGQETDADLLVLDEESTEELLEIVDEEAVEGPEKAEVEEEEAEVEEPRPAPEATPAIDQTDQASEGNHDNDLIASFINGEPGPIRADQKTSLKGDVSVASIREHDGFITDTLAKIYVKQGLYAKAIYAYEKLSLKYPEKSAYFAAQIEKIRNINHS